MHQLESPTTFDFKFIILNLSYGDKQNLSYLISNK